MNVSRGIRNNNPGNLRISDSNWRGKITPSQDPDFEQFDTMAHGIRAMAELLIAYQKIHNIRTISGIIDRYAPPSDNNPTAAYKNCVSDRTGFDKDAVLDLTTQNDLLPVVKGMCDFEQGNDIVLVPDSDFETGVNMALT